MDARCKRLFSPNLINLQILLPLIALAALIAPVFASDLAGFTGSRTAVPVEPQQNGQAPFTPRGAAILSEDFADITTLEDDDWVMTNQSDPLGSTDWFQGNTGIFTSQAGEPDAYIGANFQNTLGAGTIDNWLITPVLPLAQLAEFSFWSRSPDGSTFPDRIQVWMNITNTGSATSDFTVMLADIEPVSTSGWAQTVINSFPDAAADGRIAFRYFVINGGPDGVNSDYIGIDSLEVLADAPENHFVTTWQTDNPGTSGDTEITIPMIGGPYDVDWNNDGVFDELGLTGSVTHDFGSVGTPTVRIRGSYESIRFENGGDKDKILSIDQWGTGAWQTMEGAFWGAGRLEVPAEDAPDFSAVTSMKHMFARAFSANPDTSGWNTSSVLSMEAMFESTTIANPDTSQWDTGAVTSMRGMFRFANQANPDTSGWETEKVTDMQGMFSRAGAADPNTSNWNTSAVTDMQSMFANAEAANPDTSNWDTGAVTDMEEMFRRTIVANPDTSQWDTSSVVTMNSMFRETTAANPDTSGWDTGAVTEMPRMFQDAIAANPDTSEWETGAVTDMFAMFQGASSADPDTSGWDTGAVTNMASIFQDASAANPDASGWDVRSLGSAFEAFNDSGLTTENYEALLEGWSAQGTLESNVNLGAATTYYCSESAETARAILADAHEWNISDLGRGCGIGGEVSGLQGSGLTLRLNGGNDLPISGNGEFTFPGSLDNLTDYAVTVSVQPTDPDQSCSVTNGSDTVEGPNVSNVEVTCRTEDRIFSSSFEQPAIVVVDDVNFPIPDTVAGGSINWGTGETCNCDTNPGYDFNPWGANGDLAFWFWGVDSGDRAALSLDGTTYAVLGAGDTIGPGSSFIIEGFPSATVNWRQIGGVDGYLGFRFNNNGVVNYGYARLTTSGETGFPATITSYVYDQTGGAITIPASAP